MRFRLDWFSRLGFRLCHFNRLRRVIVMGVALLIDVGVGVAIFVRVTELRVDRRWLFRLGQDAGRVAADDAVQQDDLAVQGVDAAAERFGATAADDAVA